MKKITFGLIAYDLNKTYERLDTVLQPTMAYYKDYEFETICINNSSINDQVLAEKLLSTGRPFTYTWNGGQNHMYGPAMDRIVLWANYPILVYVCAHHGRVNSMSWLDEITAPLEDPMVAQAGMMSGSCLARAADIDMDGPAPDHIQGGIFAANVEIMRKYKYNPRLPHLCSDIWYCWKLRTEGYKLVDVPTIKSYWRCKVPNSHMYSYVHED